jgi:hypothetical protein
MDRSPQLEEKIRPKVEGWLAGRGAEFTLCIKEFCQGNRNALTRVRESVIELGILVFAGGGKDLNQELAESLEFGIFDLIGKFSSTPGGERLLTAIKANIADYLTEIFADTKRRWNFKYYKVTESLEDIDPENCLIPYPEEQEDEEYQTICARDAQRQARTVLDELVLFVKNRFRGEKIRKIAVNWLENPEKSKDFDWFASLADTSSNSIKVNLTRIRQAVVNNYHLKKSNDRLVLVRSRGPDN